MNKFCWMWKVVKGERREMGGKLVDVCQGKRQRCDRGTAKVCPWLPGILSPFCWWSESSWGGDGDWVSRFFSYFNIYQIFWKVLLCSATMCTETSTHFWGWIKLLVYTLPAFRAPFNNWQIDLWRKSFLHLLTRRYLNCVSQRARLFVTVRYNATRA